MLKDLCLTAVILGSVTVNTTAQTNHKISGPHAIVYKTKGDYRHLVPVLLSVDKSRIVSYPHPSDLRIHGKYALPTPLHKGYLLDNKGIGENVAFLRMTYEEYGKLQDPPSLADMYNMIVDKDPLVSYCDCGNKSSFKKPVKDLNRLIDRKRLHRKCKDIK